MVHMLSNTDRALVDEACRCISAFVSVSDNFRHAMMDCKPLPWLLKIVDPGRDPATAGTPAIAMQAVFALATYLESMQDELLNSEFAPVLVRCLDSEQVRGKTAGLVQLLAQDNPSAAHELERAGAIQGLVHMLDSCPEGHMNGEK